jgi:predicted ester cyclase
MADPADEVGRNTAAVRRFVDEVILGGQLDVIAELCDPDVINRAAAAGHQLGLDSMSQVIRGALVAMPDQRWLDVHLVAQDDLVVVHATREATWRAPEFRGIAIPTEGRVSGELVHIFRLRGGLIVEHWAIGDDLGLLKQLDALP